VLGLRMTCERCQRQNPPEADFCAGCGARSAPTCFATPDDLEALEACQAGYRSGAGVPWSDISRGMHRDHRGQPCVNSDERQIRAFWRRWLTQMSAWCRVGRRHMKVRVIYALERA